MIDQNSLENRVKILEMSTHADSLDLDLELRLMVRVIQSSIHEVQKHICTLGTNSLHQLERSPIHPNALIRDRGDIIQEMQCQTVEVTSSPGYQRHDKCSKEYLPMYLGEEPVYLDTSKLVTRKPILDLLDCN